MTNYFETLQNPFEIEIEDKTEYNYEDFVDAQNKLKKLNIDTFLDDLYPKDRKFNTPNDLITKRCKKSMLQNLVDPNNLIFPSKELFKIGNGGKNCFVCCTPLLDDRCNTSKTIKDSLEEVGFNGYFYLMNGGFPTPRGTELKYAGVPYCFKIFLMLEAKKLGFDKVIWLDASCYALRNPDVLFQILEEDDVVFRAFPHDLFETYDNVIYPDTISLINKMTNIDIRNINKICSIVFGLNLASPKINDFIEEYYDMVKVGLPFLSYYPEEVVFSSILNKPEYNYVFKRRGENEKLFLHECYATKEKARDWGFFFLQRIYR